MKFNYSIDTLTIVEQMLKDMIIKYTIGIWFPPLKAVFNMNYGFCHFITKYYHSPILTLHIYPLMDLLKSAYQDKYGEFGIDPYWFPIGHHKIRLKLLKHAHKILKYELEQARNNK